MARQLPDPTCPIEERLPDDDIDVEELQAFFWLAESVLPSPDSWELSQAFQYHVPIYFLPTGYVIA